MLMWVCGHVDLYESGDVPLCAPPEALEDVPMLGCAYVPMCLCAYVVMLTGVYVAMCLCAQLQLWSCADAWLCLCGHVGLCERGDVPLCTPRMPCEDVPKRGRADVSMLVCVVAGMCNCAPSLGPCEDVPMRGCADVGLRACANVVMCLCAHLGGHVRLCRCAAVRLRACWFVLSW